MKSKSVLKTLTLGSLVLLGISCTPANAQTISINSLDRTTSSYTGVNSYDGILGENTSTPYASADPTVESTLDGNYTAAFNQGATQTYGRASVDLTQNSTISDSATSLVISGTLQVSASAHRSDIDNGPEYQDSTGAGIYYTTSSLSVNFSLDQPFTFSLNTTISVDASPNNTNQYYVALIGESGLLYQFGIGSYNAFQINGSNSGDFTGVLPAGQYDFETYLYGTNDTNPPNEDVPLGDTNTDNSVAVSLDVTAVPEPSTWVMMIAGVGALFAFRRRQPIPS